MIQWVTTRFQRKPRWPAGNPKRKGIVSFAILDVYSGNTLNLMRKTSFAPRSNLANPGEGRLCDLRRFRERANRAHAHFNVDGIQMAVANLDGRLVHLTLSAVVSIHVCRATLLLGNGALNELVVCMIYLLVRNK